ncbi:MAG: hypothetical protein ACN6RH_13490 [Stenotrophomonas rhizophila]|jgi:type VI secretion system secreted protein VgrG|uniref:hypothetical protein n=1 Tax=Stenotrophomonas rhizophila TaxID=216778 RepID=UPI0010BFBABD|nr:hypothetical protein [Stenotrophomonas rhizophila]TKK07248.1 hypothetical protein SrhCFBP13529_10640 [Stenotrophomonas rhizophila]
MPGNFIVKASQHPFLEGEFGTAPLAALPDTRVKLFDEGFVLKDEATGDPLPNVAYRILLKGGSSLDGITDRWGRTHVVGSAVVEEVTLHVREA